MVRTIVFFLISAFIVPNALAASLLTTLTVIVIPNAPSAVSASAGSQSQVNLSWTDNSNNETGFSIERSTGSDTNFSQIATVAPNITIYSDGGLSANTAYFYRVSAFDRDGFSASSNIASAMTPTAPVPPPPSGGGGSGGGGGGSGGGGGGFTPSVFKTEAIFRGIAYPGSRVTLIENGQVFAVTQAGPDARFEIDAMDGISGIYNFGVWAIDPGGGRSITQTFEITLADGATTVISGIFLPPTIGADKRQVKRGDVITMLGYTAPQATVTVVVHSARSIAANVISSDEGAWTYQLPTDILDYGDHTATAHAAADGAITTDSTFITFTVGDSNIAAPQMTCASLIGDSNDDCKIDLVDFSVMAYWYRRPNPPVMVDLNHDGVVNLVDFSILAYYWTG